MFIGSRRALISGLKALTKNCIAASRAQIPTALQGTAAVVGYTWRKEYWASPLGDITDIVLHFVGWYVGASVAAIPSAIDIKVFLEYPVNVFTQVTFALLTTGTIPASTTAKLKSDPSRLRIPAGSKFWVRIVNISAGSRQFPLIELPAVATTIGVTDGSDATDKGNSGTIAATGGVGTYGPSAISATVLAKNARSFVVVGNSLAWGQGDVSSVGSKGGSGWISRKLDAFYPSVKLCKAGILAQQIATAAFYNSYLGLISDINFTDVISEAGLNDLTGNRTQAQIEGNWQTIYGLFAGKRIFQTTLTARTTSTDTYATTTFQTPKTDGNMAALNSLNAGVRAIAANVSGCIDAADFDMSARDSDIHAGPFPPVLDGTHFTSAKAAAMAALWTVA